MKYQSELIKEIVDTRGHKKSSLHYESECTETWIEEAKGAYPKLCDYESEWLNYISILDDTGGSEDPEPPIGEFPYVVLSDVTEATIDDVVPYAYKSAILTGQTLVNVVSEQSFGGSKTLYESRFFDSPFNKDEKFTIFVVNPNVTTIKMGLYEASTGNWQMERQYNVNNNKRVVYTVPSGYCCKYVGVVVLTPNDATGFENSLVIVSGDKSNLEIENYFEGMQSVKIPVLTTSNEDGTKTNILTVNENVELGGIGNVRDELNCLTGEVTERIANIVFDGTEEWKNPVVYANTVRYMSPKLENYKPNSKNVLMSGLPHIYSHNLDEAHCAIELSGYLFVFIPKTELEDTTVNSVKKYFQRKNAQFQYELAEPNIKTVDLTITNQDGETLNKLKPFEGTMHLSTSSDTIKPLFSGEIPVEAITQNLASFIDLETEE